jgi:flagellar protein FlaH
MRWLGMLKLRIIPLGIKEMDEVLGGGIPHPTLITVEGGHGTGKTSLAQQIIYSALREGLKAYVITTEAKVREYLSMMEALKLNVYSYFIRGALKIYPLHIRGGEWSDETLQLFMNLLRLFLEERRGKYDFAVVDSLSVLAAKTSHSEFLTFITKVKNIVSEGKTVILTFHPNFISEDLLRELKASSDVYIVLKNVNVFGMSVKSLEVVKIWGAGSKRKSVLFEVDPNLGLRVVPIAGVKV